MDFNSPVSDEDFMIKIVEALPKNFYGDLITIFFRHMSNTVDPLTISSLKTQFRDHYRHKMMKVRINDVTDRIDAFYVKQFKGQCRC